MTRRDSGTLLGENVAGEYGDNAQWGQGMEWHEGFGDTLGR